MLQSPTGTTIAAMMEAAGWQQHSGRGFLAAGIGRRLKWNLAAGALRNRRLNARRYAVAHLPRHLLFRVLAYRPQADQPGDLDGADLQMCSAAILE
jgi:Protein of unknown function (DUF3489)